jgi:acyl carrier protein
MENGEISERVKKVVANVLEMDESEITEEANFIFDLGADSMQSIKLIAAFDEEFGIEMDEDKAAAVQNVSGAVDFISGYVN